QHIGADHSKPVGGGVRVVCTDEPWSFHAHLGPGERLFVVPRIRVPLPLPYELWAWAAGAAEIHVATAIWPTRLRAWGMRMAEQYFENHVQPLIDGSHNRPDWWWQRPSDWDVGVA